MTLTPNRSKALKSLHYQYTEWRKSHEKLPKAEDTMEVMSNALMQMKGIIELANLSPENLRSATYLINAAMGHYDLYINEAKK